MKRYIRPTYEEILANWHSIPPIAIETVDKLTNADRAARAKEGLVAYKGPEIVHDPDPQSMVIDLLADLRHLCDQIGLDFDGLNRMAAEHHDEEVSEEREAAKGTTV